MARNAFRLMMLVAVVFFLFAVHTTPAADGDPDEPDVKTCRACNSTGKVPCRIHTAKVRGKFRVVCSLCKQPSCCGGLGWKVCNKCQREDIQDEWDAEMEAWKAEASHDDNYPDMYGERLNRAATQHFRIQGLFSHSQIHDLADKLERTYAYYLTVFGEDAGEELPWDKCYVNVYEQRDSFMKFAEETAKNMGPEAAMWLDAMRQTRGFRNATYPHDTACRAPIGARPRLDDQTLYQGIVHGVGHILLDTYGMPGGTRARTPAWLGEGFGGVCEKVVLGAPATYCISFEYGGPPPPSNKKALWVQTLKNAIKSDSLRPFAELCRLEFNSMNGRDWAQAIAIVDELVQQPEKFVDFAVEVRGGSDPVEALEAHYDLTPEQLRAKWIARFNREARKVPRR